MREVALSSRADGTLSLMQDVFSSIHSTGSSNFPARVIKVLGGLKDKMYPIVSGT